METLSAKVKARDIRPVRMYIQPVFFEFHVLEVRLDVHTCIK
jgi:hypothetical protein